MEHRYDVINALKTPCTTGLQAWQNIIQGKIWLANMKNLNKRSKLTMCQATVSQVKQQANSRKKTVVYGTTDLH